MSQICNFVKILLTYENDHLGFYISIDGIDNLPESNRKSKVIDLVLGHFYSIGYRLNDLAIIDLDRLSDFNI